MYISPKRRSIAVDKESVGIGRQNTVVVAWLFFDYRAAFSTQTTISLRIRLEILE